MSRGPATVRVLYLIFVGGYLLLGSEEPGQAPPKSRAQMAAREPRTELIPWDFENSEHVERMYLQRVACGWRCEEVHDQWVKLSRAGEKGLYWVVST